MPRTVQEVLRELRDHLRRRAAKRGLLEGSAAYDSYVFGIYNREKNRVMERHRTEPAKLQQEMDAAKLRD